MKGNSEKGMTVLEVAIALTILLIGVAFIMKTDVISHRYAYKGQVKDQMLFYASGILEAQIEGVTPTVNKPSFANFTHEIIGPTPVEDNDYLEKVTIKVYLRNSPSDPDPVILSTYRVKIE